MSTKAASAWATIAGGAGPSAGTEEARSRKRWTDVRRASFSAADKDQNSFGSKPLTAAGVSQRAARVNMSSTASASTEALSDATVGERNLAAVVMFRRNSARAISSPSH